mmetsp:Transcript_262/g.363  ORF Transcript_262/g.363 Transcript_262/m.363 type:complete len:281 (+) Transcript_262:482-1324(+)
MELGLKISATKKDPSVQTFLLSMMDQLESVKSQHPDVSDTAASEAVIRAFAQEKLTEAEEEYLGRRGNKNTARRYYAAASFFEVLATFLPDKQLDEATKKSALFAKWRATEILKAIKEGRPPVPEEEEVQEEEDTTQLDFDLPPAAPTMPPAAPAFPVDPPAKDADDDDNFSFMPPAAPTAPPSAPSFPPSAPSHPPAARADSSSDSEDDDKYQYKKPAASKSRPNVSRKFSSDGSGRGDFSDNQKKDALEYARFAVRALETDDLYIAKQHLESALKQLR